MQVDFENRYIFALIYMYFFLIFEQYLRNLNRIVFTAMRVVCRFVIIIGLCQKIDMEIYQNKT